MLLKYFMYCKIPNFMLIQSSERQPYLSDKILIKEAIESYSWRYALSMHVNKNNILSQRWLCIKFINFYIPHDLLKKLPKFLCILVPWTVFKVLLATECIKKFYSAISDLLPVITICRSLKSRINYIWRCLMPITHLCLVPLSLGMEAISFYSIRTAVNDVKVKFTFLWSSSNHF